MTKKNLMAERHYELAETTDAKAVVLALKPLGMVEVEPVRSGERVVIDTFDWSLFSAGLYLEELREAGQVISVCRRLSDELRIAAATGAMPRFVHELPPGPLSRTLLPLANSAALLRHVQLRREVVALRLLDKRGKTVVRLQIQHQQVMHRTTLIPLPSRLHLMPLRGYGRAAGRAA